MMRRFILMMISVLMLAVSMPVSAQFEVQDAVIFVPFVNETFGLRGLRPSTWVENEGAEGVFLRARDPYDTTAIIIQSTTDSLDELLARLQESFALEVVPEPLATIESESLTWTIYQFQRVQNNSPQLVDMAIAESDEVTYYVLMQTAQVFYDILHQEVFLPVIDSVSPAVYYQPSDESFSIPVPTLWTVEEAETYGAFTSPDAGIAVYAAAVETDDVVGAMQELWQSINPDFESIVMEDTVQAIDDPAILKGLDQIVVAYWQNGRGEGAIVQQGVARVYEGVAYILLIDTTVQAVQARDVDVAIIDQGLLISALQPIPAEATAEATEAGQ